MSRRTEPMLTATQAMRAETTPRCRQGRTAALLCRCAVTLVGAVVALSAATGCAPSDVVQLQLDDAGGLREGAAVVLDGAAIGKVAHLRFAKNGGAAVAELALQPEAFARLDPDSIWAVRPAPGDDPEAKIVLVSNLCAEQPRGIARRADVQGSGMPLFQLLPQLARRHAACLERRGGFGALRSALGAPRGLGAAVAAPAEASATAPAAP